MNTTSRIWKLIALGLALALILVVALGIGGWVVTRAYAQRPWGGYGMMGPGMMGGWGYGSSQGYQGCPMMGPWSGTYPEGTKTQTIDEAKTAVERSLKTWNNADLAVDEVMEFSNNFYAIVQEKSTGVGAFEVLVDKVIGAVYPEPGPNMMWNLKYGMMGGYGMMGPGMMGGWGYGGAGGTTEPTLSADMPVDKAQAIELAQKYLDATRPGITADEEEVYPFYGYYTLHVLKDGQVTGMLSVNGYTGQVWYHTWHGAFMGTTEH